MKKVDSRYFYIVLVFSLSIALFFSKVVTEIFPNAPTQLSTRVIEITFLIIGAFTVRKTQFVQPGLGFRIEKNKRKKTILYLIALTAICLLILFLGRIVGQIFIPGMKQRPYFGLYLNMPKRRYYIVVAVVQEVLSKCYLQYGIEKTLPDNKWKVSVFLVGAIFGMLHVFYSSLYMILACIFGIASGIYYHYRKEVWTPIIIHFVFGFFVRSFGLIG